MVVKYKFVVNFIKNHYFLLFLSFFIVGTLFLNIRPVFAIDYKNLTDTEKRDLGIYFVDDTPPPAACGTSPSGANSGAIGPNSYVLGDSISAGLHNDGIEVKLQAALGGTSTVNHDSGRSITQPGTEVKQSAINAADSDKLIIGKAGTIIVVLGTNPTDDPFSENLDLLYAKLKGYAPSAKIYWVDIGATRANTAAVWSARNKIIYDAAKTLGFTVISRYKAIFGQDKDPLNIQPGLAIPGSSDNVHGAYPQLSKAIVDSVTNNGSSVSGGSANSCSCSALAGADNAEKIYNYLIGKGLKPFQAAGLMGNMEAEAHFEPRLVEYAFSSPPHLSDTVPPDQNSKGQPGYGLIQWTSPGRKQGLRDIATAKGLSTGNLGLQMDYLWQELTTKYKTVYDNLIASSDVESATYIILHDYETPSDIPGQRPIRTGFAKTILAKFGSNSGSGGFGVISC